ncbi:valencene synthase-like [Syzygium oleosum]|uniref:valencene synthase-like n=1 Tax=Syzygium oleosum TaxID=219896 RepID=UPI0024BBB0A9|nr:valencene synthase-like [Syzygium oleosum]
MARVNSNGLGTGEGTTGALAGSFGTALSHGWAHGPTLGHRQGQQLSGQGDGGDGGLGGGSWVVAASYGGGLSDGGGEELGHNRERPGKRKTEGGEVARWSGRHGKRRLGDIEPADEWLSSTKRAAGANLKLIDQIQRLGIAYHLEIEIDEQLEQIHRSYFRFHYGDDDDLHTVALLIRLLRQQGYTISSEIFNKFKDSKGNFSKSLIAGVQGLLSLFEACHLGFPGNDKLNDAFAFTITHLESIDKGKASPNLKKQVRHALNQPIHEGIPRLEVRRYIPLYQEEPSHNDVLLSLAKLDFNSLQEQHIDSSNYNLSGAKYHLWWKDSDVERKFPFARDRLVEMYLWMSGVYFEPEYEAAREILTKVAYVVSIIETSMMSMAHRKNWNSVISSELDLRWDVDAKDGLPGYMQVCYKILFDLYDEIGYEMKNQVRAYFAEAKWFHQNHVPTMEEYMPLALATFAVELLLVTLLLGMGDIVTKGAFDWLLFGDPKMVEVVKLVGRLMGDNAGHKFEQERGHGASSVECFMKQYGVMEEEAKEELHKQVADGWTDINEEMHRPIIILGQLLKRILNFTRSMHVVYKEEIDLYTHAGTKLKEHVKFSARRPIASVMVWKNKFLWPESPLLSVDFE